MDGPSGSQHFQNRAVTKFSPFCIMFVTCAPSQGLRFCTWLAIALTTIATCVPMVSFGLTRDLLLSGLPAWLRGSDKSGSNRFLCTIFTLSSPPMIWFWKLEFFQKVVLWLYIYCFPSDPGFCVYLKRQYISITLYHPPSILHIRPCGHNIICSFPIPS